MEQSLSQDPPSRDPGERSVSMSHLVPDREDAGDDRTRIPTASGYGGAALAPKCHHAPEEYPQKDPPC